MPRHPRASARKARVWLALLLAVAFAARLGWALLQPTSDEAIDRLPDQREYLTLAQNLLHGRGLQFYDARFDDTVHAYRTPGYPAFMAACRANPRLIRAAQAIIDTSTVLAIYLLARALLRTDPNRRAALLAGATVAANPFLVYFSALLLSEALFTAMLAWGMLLLVVGGRGARLRREGPEENVAEDPPKPPRRGLGTLLWLSGGLVLALSGLVRPSAAPLAALLGIAAAFVNRPGPAAYQGYSDAGVRDDPRWPLPVGSTMALLTVAVLLPWAVRNYRALGAWVWTTTNGGVTLYDGFNPDATGGGSDQSFLRAMPQLSRMGEVGRSEYLAARAKAFVREYPARAAQLAALHAGRTWTPVPLSREHGGWRNRVVAGLYSVPFDLLVLVGLFGSRQRTRLRRSAKVFLLVPAIYFTAVHALSVGSLRYRVPVEPPMAILAAAALASAVPMSTPRWKRAGDGSGGVDE